MRMEFFVKDAAAGRHPLHVARADAAASAGGVLMLHFALVDDGHGLEAAVRMLADAARTRRRFEWRGRRMVQHQEGTELAGPVRCS